jgi:hypothetical protein
MARRATDFGVFGVLSFGDEYPANTSQLQISNIKGENHTLDFILPIAASNTGLPYLRSLIFDLSKQDPPSRVNPLMFPQRIIEKPLNRVERRSYSRRPECCC